MVARKFTLLFLVLFSLGVFAQAIDSDQDNVSDEQELIDGTDPQNPEDNLLDIRIDGSLVVGSTVNLFLVHPSLGRIKNTDFTFFFGESKQSLNSGSSGAVSFTIASAGRHLVKVKKNAFSRSIEFYPECAVLLPAIAEFSSAIDVLALFVSLIIAMLSFAGFKKLLFATEADYPLRKHPTIVPAYVGVSAFVMMVYIYQSLGQMLGMIALFFCLFFLLLVLWIFKVKGLIKPVPEQVLPKKTKRAIKGIAFPTLLFAAIVERLRGRKKEKAAEARGKLREMMELKRDISESIGRFEEAKKRTIEAREKKRKQEAMDELRAEVASFNQYIKRLFGLKKKEVKPVKTEREKSLAELREEKRLKIMVEDLLDQMAREMDMKELPEVEVKEEGAKPKKKNDIVKKIISIFIGEKKQAVEKANVEISLFDEFDNPLQASKAEFFVGGKKVKPVYIKGNSAGFWLREGEHQIFVRMLGFVDSFLELEAVKEKRSFKARLVADLKLIITDEKGKHLRDAFVNIVDENGKKVEDSLQNIIWRSPTPSNAPDGIIAIPLNPKDLSFNSLKIKVVRANYSLKEIIIPTNRISTQKVFEKTVSLEEITK